MQNPSDIGSGGSQGDKLNKLWLEGPSWLKNKQLWPKDITTKATEQTKAESKIIKDVPTTAIKSDELWNLIDKFSLLKTLRITSRIRRFFYICKKEGSSHERTTSDRRDRIFKMSMDQKRSIMNRQKSLLVTKKDWICTRMHRVSTFAWEESREILQFIYQRNTYSVKR